MSDLVDVVSTQVADSQGAARFANLRRLGDGAEGGAWQADDTERGGAPVVLKWVPGPRRLIAERAFRLLRLIGSPHLPALVELLDSSDGGCWLVSEHIEGRSLGRGPVPLEQALFEGLGVARALAALGDVGSHHGDVSANNVLHTDRGIVLIDFGQVGEHGSGTTGFLAPEVLAGEGGLAADLFALGSLLCQRLFGEVPWRDPVALVQLRSSRDVDRRLDQLSAHAIEPVPRAVLDVCRSLLQPDPSLRAAQPKAVAVRLDQLWRSVRNEVGVDELAALHVPRRWPYVGLDLSAVVERMRGDGAKPGPGAVPRLVVVVGPPGSGRERTIVELVAMWQQARVPATVVDVQGLARHCQRSATSWLQTWSEARAQATEVLGLVGVLEWPEQANTPALRAALLKAAAAWAQHVLIVALAPDEARPLVRDPSDDVLVVELVPWSVADCETALTRAAASSQPGRWARAVVAVTDGWPGHTVRTLESIARDGGISPDSPRLAELARNLDAAVDVGQALTRLLHHWQADGSRSASNESLEEVGACSLATARVVLGADLVEYARLEARARERSGHSIGLALAMDAQLQSHVSDLLATTAEPWPDEVLAWIERAASTNSLLRIAAARQRLAAGQPERALQTVAPSDSTPAALLESARALAAMGRRDEARDRLAVLLGDNASLGGLASPSANVSLEGSTGDADMVDLRWRALGLAWRLLVDDGQSPRARALAASVRDDSRLQQGGIGAATAGLWAGFAAVQLHDTDEAQQWLSQTLAWLGDITTPDARRLRARVYQVLASQAHVGGELARAAKFYTEAIAEFEAAGESVGVLLCSASLGALAVPAGLLGEGERRGIESLRGLIAAAQISALPAAVANTVLCLVALGRAFEAKRWLKLVTDVVQAAGEVSDVARLRLERAALEIEVAECLDPVVDERTAALIPRATTLAEQAYELGLSHESIDLYLLAARLDSGDANRWLDVIAERVAELDDAVLAHRWRLLHLQRAAAANDTASVRQDIECLAEFPRVEELVGRGHLELAWIHDRDLLAAVSRSSAEGLRAAAFLRHRALQTLELVMQNVSSLDREATHQRFVAELERDPIAALALRDEATTPAPVAAAPSVGTGSTDRLLRIYRRLAREEDLPALLDQVVEAMMELTSAERGVVVVGEGEAQLEVAREIDRQVDAVKFSRSILRKVIETGDAVLSVDAAEDLRFGESRSVSHLHLRSVLAVPLIYRGAVLGAVYVDHRLRRGAFGEQDLAYLEDFANLVALAVAHARALGGLRAQAHALEVQQEQLARLLAEREAEVAELRAEARHAGLDVGQHRGMIGSSKAMQQVFALIERVADSPVPVVIHGESGTGKELVARAIHDAGVRRERPFVAENCGAVPDSLLESVLFGHARGAFTGADRARAGLFEAADGGTIFLDEVGEMSPAMQTALLRVLQEGEVRRIGETQSRRVDVRVIAASNRGLEQLVEAGAFRRDLYYRIQVVNIDLPPLRDRRDDLPDLVAHFLRRHGGDRLRVSGHAMRLLLGYGWPGNVRELENEVQRWVALAEEKVRPDDLSPQIRAAIEGEIEDPDDLHLRTRVDRLERVLIARALERTDNNQTRAAALLGLSRFGLQKKLRRLAGDLDDTTPTDVADSAAGS